MSTTGKKKLYFWQPPVGVSVSVHSTTTDGKSGRGRTIAASSYCRAILNRDLSSRVRNLLMKKKTELKPNWAGEMIPTLVGYDPVRSLIIREKDGFATLRISSSGLRSYRKCRYSWGYGGWSPDRTAISLARVKDFYYLADLLCGTFGVLFDPREGVRVRKVVEPTAARKIERTLDYPVSGPEILFHPALVAMFLGQLRLAAFLAAAGEAQAIAKVAPRAQVRRAIASGNRAACVNLLRKVGKWVLRSESGMWAFNYRGRNRYNKLLTYLEKGGTAVSLFGNSIPKNWSLTSSAAGDMDFHNRGFQDYMGRSGDKKLSARSAALKEED